MSDQSQPLGAGLLNQSRQESGLHTSGSDSNPHLTVKNAEGKVTGHYYPDGSVKDFNGSLGWLSGTPNPGS